MEKEDKERRRNKVRGKERWINLVFLLLILVGIFMIILVGEFFINLCDGIW